MNTLSMCRICRVQDVKMYLLVSAELQELYEKLSEIQFETADGRPLQICYICHARLQNCYRLQTQCHQSEEIFAKIIADNMIKHIELQDVNTLNMVHPLIVLSCKPFASKEPDDGNIDDGDWKIYPLEIKSEVQIKDEHFEDQKINNQYTKEMVESNDIRSEIDDIVTNEQTIEETEAKHNLEMKTVKIVLERIDLKQFDANAPVTKKPRLVKEDTQNDILIKPEHGVTIKQNTNDAQNNILSKPEPEIEQNSNINKKIHIKGKTAIVKNNNIVKQISFTDKSMAKKKTVDKVNSVHIKENPHTCEVCGKCFTRKRNVIIHARIHTGVKPYKCDICDRRFNVKCSLMRHIHIHTGVKPFKCYICDRRFSDKSCLTRHIRIHTGVKPYTCDMCDKTFSQKSSLMIHTHIHTGVKPYKCDICDSRFRLKASLIGHIHLHIGVKPYKCDICEKKFSRSSDVVRHAHIHTGVKRYKCDMR